MVEDMVSLLINSSPEILEEDQEEPTSEEIIQELLSIICLQMKSAALLRNVLMKARYDKKSI